MARKRPLRDAGTVVVLEHRSTVLAGNPLGDPYMRKVAVWLPREYDRRDGGPGQRLLSRSLSPPAWSATRRRPG